jgi:mono/diheme cytochrome c family protein
VGVRWLLRLTRARDTTRSVTDRARSYLDANCAQCHRPGGTVAGFDARYDTPLAKQNLINGSVLIDEGIDGARIVAPHDPWRSILLMRVSRLDGTRMPPLAHAELDRDGVALLREWIESMPGPPVLPPPEIVPVRGPGAHPVAVVLKTEPGASVHYTTDGSVPASSDPVYVKPIPLQGPMVIRAKAFKPGFTKSITSQQIFGAEK